MTSCSRPPIGPSDAEVAQVHGTIRRRVGRLLRRRSLEPGADGEGPEDPLAETSLALAGIVGASVQGRVGRDRATDPRAGDAAAPRPRYWTWALLMRRAFDLDVLRCPHRAGRIQLIATIDDPAVVQRILAHLGLPGAREDPGSPLPVTVPGAEQPTLPSMSV